MAVFLRWIRQAASLESPTVVKPYIDREKTVTYIHKYVLPRIQVFTCIHTYIYFY